MFDRHENNQLYWKFLLFQLYCFRILPYRYMKKFYLLTYLLVLVTVVAEAQSFYTARRDRSLIATLGLNTSTYYGDLKDNSDIIDAMPSLSLGIMTSLTQNVFVRGELSWITLSGRDEESSNEGKLRRNLSFSSNNFEFNVSGVFHLMPVRGRFYQRPNYNLYGFLGLGGLYFNPKAELNGQKHALQPLMTEGIKYSRLALVIPFGLGAKAKITPFVNLAIEAGWRKTFTDYIDDVSTVYVDNASFSDPIAKQLADRRPEIGLPVYAEGKKRGDPSNKDAYMLLTFKVEYYLPYQVGQNRIYNRKRRPYNR